MAIQIDLTHSQYGIPFSGAYFRIATASISRQRSGDYKFSVMIDVVGYGTNQPGDDTREVDFRRYHTPLEEIETQQGAAFLDKCYAWVMAQADMAGSQAV
jgi:hypothetical protein